MNKHKKKEVPTAQIQELKLGVWGNDYILEVKLFENKEQVYEGEYTQVDLYASDFADLIKEAIIEKQIELEVEDLVTVIVETEFKFK